MWTRLGVKYRKAKGGNSRWGEGKVHVVLWDRLNKSWITLCRREGAGPFGKLLTEVPDSTPTTCKWCINLEGATRRARNVS